MRTGKPMTLSAPQFFFAQDRSVADEAYAGDVVGIPNHGTLRIGDTLTEGEDIAFLGVPNFAPEILRRVKLGDPMKAKKLKEALQQMAEEGVVQVFRPLDGAPALVGVVGPLQLDVLKVRLARRIRPRHRLRDSRNSSWRAGLPAPTARSSTISCRPIIRASPKTSTATACSWRATSSSSTTPRERAPGIVFTDIKDVKNKGSRQPFRTLHACDRPGMTESIHLHVRRLDHRRPARDFAVDARRGIAPASSRPAPSIARPACRAPPAA